MTGKEFKEWIKKELMTLNKKRIEELNSSINEMDINLKRLKQLTLQMHMNTSIKFYSDKRQSFVDEKRSLLQSGGSN